MYLKIFFSAILALSLLSCHTNRHAEARTALADFIAKNASDQRERIFDIRPGTKGNTLVLRGETDDETLKNKLIQQMAPFNVLDSIVLLPDSTTGNKPWGLITLSVANLRAAPNHAAELVTQALMGTPVKILKHRKSWYQVQTPDRYIAWIDNDGLMPVSETDFNTWKHSKRLLFTGDNGLIYQTPAFTEVLSDVSTGNVLEAVRQAGKTIQVRFPDGRTGFTPAENWEDFDSFKSSISTDTLVLKNMAQGLLGRPYLWGGTSARAMDCSGFVKMLYFMNGMVLARDASLQTRHGQTIVPDENHSNLQTGDLLFFGTQKPDSETARITHVALSLGGTEFIHASGRIRLNSLNPRSTVYSEYRKNTLRIVKRIAGVDSCQQTLRIEHHPWY